MPLWHRTLRAVRLQGDGNLMAIQWW